MHNQNQVQVLNQNMNKLEFSQCSFTKKTSIQSHYDDFEFCFCEAEHCKYSAAFWQVSSSQAVYMLDMCKGLWPHCVACICNEWSHGICWESFETKQQIKTPADRWGVTALINLLEGIKMIYKDGGCIEHAVGGVGHPPCRRFHGCISPPLWACLSH